MSATQTSSPHGEPMTVVRLEVDSYKRVRAASLAPAPTGLVPIRGRNAAGKSSLIDAMLATLAGGKDPLPIQEGAHAAEVVVDLGAIVVKRRWTRDSGGKAKAVLTVEAGDGSVRYASPQQVLDGLVGHFADPVVFLSARPEDQVKTVLRVIGLDERLEALEQDAAEAYERRRELGRDADRTRAAAETARAEVAALAPVDVEYGPAALSAALAALEEGRQKNNALGVARLKRDSAGKSGVELKQRRDQLVAEIAQIDARLVEVKGAYVAAETAIKALGGEVAVSPLLQHVEAIQAGQRDQARRDAAREREAEAVEAAKLHDECDSQLQSIRRSVSDLLEGAAFPIEGMAYDAEKKRLTIGGIPFESASQAERIKAAASVAMAGNPRIRVLFVRDGSLLDEESRALLARMAEERGFQTWIEFVDSKREGVGVWVEDGEATISEAIDEMRGAIGGGE